MVCQGFLFPFGHMVSTSFISLEDTEAHFITDPSIISMGHFFLLIIVTCSSSFFLEVSSPSSPFLSISSISTGLNFIGNFFHEAYSIPANVE